MKFELETEFTQEIGAWYATVHLLPTVWIGYENLISRFTLWLGIKFLLWQLCFSLSWRKNEKKNCR